MSIVSAIMVPHPPMIIPEVGKGSEAMIQETIDAYEKASQFLAATKPDTVIVASPHNVLYTDYFNISDGEHATGSMEDFNADDVRIEVGYDTEMIAEFCRLADKDDVDAGLLGQRGEYRELDHATLIPLYFLTKYYTDFKVLRIGLSGLPYSEHYRVGMLLKKAAEKTGRRAAFIGSGDLSHKLSPFGPYGFAEEGPYYDERIMDVMGRAAFGELLDFDPVFCDKAAECGHRAFIMMAGALDRTSVTPERLSYQDVTGVGYGVCTYTVNGPDETRNLLDQWNEKKAAELSEKKKTEDSYVKLARKTIETYVKTGQKISVPEDLPAEMTGRKAGVFVSLHKEGQLRGCIGTIKGLRDSVANEIIENAISSSTRDTRFRPVRTDELDKLEYSVDVLGNAEPVRSLKELDVKKYGVIVTQGPKSGLLLPNLDGVDTPVEQIKIAKRKAGIPEKDNNVKVYRFEVVRHY